MSFSVFQYSPLEQWKKDLEGLFPAIAPYKATVVTQVQQPTLPDDQLAFQLMKEDRVICSFALDHLPATRLLVSHSMFVGDKFLRRGVATQIMWFKKRIIKELKYDGLVCTVNNTNKAEIGLLTKTHWKKVQDFGTFSLWVTFPEG